MTLSGATPATLTIDGGAEDTLVNIENVTGGYGSNWLTGAGKANVLDGGWDGDNRLEGGGGNDTLKGGAGNDIFVFHGNDGADKVTDCEDGADRFDLSAVAGVDGIGDLAVTTSSAGVPVDYGSGSFLVANVADAAVIGASDFIF